MTNARMCGLPLALALALGCSGGGATMDGGDDASGTVDGPGRDAAPTCGAGVYPCGPYGYARGNIAENLNFLGLRDDNGDGSLADEAALQAISFADFHRANVNPPAGQPRINYLFINVSAGWCTVCRAENRTFAAAYAARRPQGIEFLEILIETNRQNENADEQFLRDWARLYHLPFPMALDPGNAEMGHYFDKSATPLNMVIRLCDMQIVYQATGWDEEGLSTRFDRYARETNPCGK